MTRTDYNMAGRLGAKCRALPIKINKKLRGGEAQKLNVKKSTVAQKSMTGSPVVRKVNNDRRFDRNVPDWTPIS